MPNVSLKMDLKLVCLTILTAQSVIAQMLDVCLAFIGSHAWPTQYKNCTVVKDKWIYPLINKAVELFEVLKI